MFKPAEHTNVPGAGYLAQSEAGRAALAAALCARDLTCAERDLQPPVGTKQPGSNRAARNLRLVLWRISLPYQVYEANLRSPVFISVEMRGLEPLTSALQRRRSPN